MNIELYNHLYEILKKTKYDKQDHWDIFDDTYYNLIAYMDNLENFRTNGMSNMLETGLPSQDRNTLLENGSTYSTYYDKHEIHGIVNRFEELVIMLGDDLDKIPFNDNTGCPRNYLHQHNEKEYMLNFDDLYQIYATWQINRFANQLNNKMDIVVEIGGGYGDLAHKIKSLYKKTKYIIIDLPEVLLLQHYYLKKVNPNLKIINLIDNINIDVDNDNFDILLLPFGEFEKYNFKFDMVINMRSLGEMPKDVLNKYMKWIHSNLNIDGLFYNVNRYVFTKSNDKNKIRDCPYDDNWNVLLSKPQWLQTHLHEFMLMRNDDNKIPIQFLLQSFPITTPPPGPILTNIQSQEDWLKSQRLLK